MGFKCGIVGLPNVCKSTLFNALTNSSKAQAENFPFCTIDPNIGIVPVPDKRLDELTKISVSDYVLNNFNDEEKIELEKTTTNIIDSMPILLDKKLDLFSSTVNNK